MKSNQTTAPLQQQLVTGELFNELANLSLKDLRPGDVILSRGICPGKKLCISDVIVKLDGGDYSHAAFFDGEHFVQATTKGVKASDPVRQKEHQSYLHVYRFHNEQGEPLDSPSLPSKPLVDVSHTLLNTPYAYDELVLVATLVLMRQITHVSLLKDIIEVFGGVALTKLRNWIKKHVLHNDEDSIICSELVARTYWSASPSKGVPYGLPIPITHRHKLKALATADASDVESQQDYQELMRNLESLLSETQPQLMTAIDLHREQQQLMQGANSRDVLIGGSTLLPANCVSPCDLQRSPALKLMGNYID